jgi:preprotein translocase subunit YajC
VLLAEEPSGGGAGILNFLPFILIIAAFYFLMIRPANKRRREEQELQSSLTIGDEIRTAGGLYGTVVAMDDESVTVQASPGVELRFLRGAIRTVVRKIDEPEEELVEDEEGTDEPGSRKDRD